MNKETLIKNYLKAIILYSIFWINNIMLIRYLYQINDIAGVLVMVGWTTCILMAIGIFIKLEKNNKDKGIKNG